MPLEARGQMREYIIREIDRITVTRMFRELQLPMRKRLFLPVSIEKPNFHRFQVRIDTAIEHHFHEPMEDLGGRPPATNHGIETILIPLVADILTPQGHICVCILRNIRIATVSQKVLTVF